MIPALKIRSPYASRPRRWCGRVSILSALIFLFVSGLSARQDGDLIILNHADSLVGMEIAGEPARQLIGNVQFSQGSLTVRCERAIQYLRSNRVYFDGLVQVNDDSVRMVGQRALYYAETRTVEAFDRILLEDGSTTLQARYGTYSAEEKKAYFRDNVIVADTTSVLTAYEVRFDRNEEILLADSNVRIEDSRQGVVSLAEHFENRRREGYSKLTGNPRMLQYGTGTPPETLFVSGRMIESIGDTLRRLVVTDSVRIFRDGLTGTAGLAVFIPDGDLVQLFRSPYLWYDGEGGTENQVSGDSVIVTLTDNSADNVRVSGRATAVSQTDAAIPGRYNQLAGQEIFMYFDGRKLKEIEVRRTAMSLYYLFEEGEPDGLNRSSGNGVTIMFKDGRVESIRILENVEGKYVPEHLVAGKEEEYNLPGFQWRSDKPVRDW